MIRKLCLCLALLAAPLQAQEATNTGTGAMLRGLDKITGRAYDIALRAGETAQFDRIEISLQECRYPEGDRRAMPLPSSPCARPAMPSRCSGAG